MQNAGRKGGILGLLAEARRLTSIMIDLSIYSLAFRDRLAALETLMLENDVDDTVGEAVALMSLAIRSPQQARLARGIVELATALDRASDAAGDLAQLALRGYMPHPFVAASAVCCGEVVAAFKASRGSPPLDVVDVMLVRRRGRTILGPENMEIEPGDVVVVRGSLDGVVEAAETVGSSLPIRVESVDAVLADESARGIARVKALARAGFDAALYSLLAGDANLADTVLDMEEVLDDDIIRLMEGLASHPAGPGGILTGFTFLASLEDISDSAAMIARVTRDGLASDILGRSIDDPWESYLRLTYSGARMRMSQLDLDSEGILVVAAKVGDRWIIPSLEDPELGEGDIVIAKVYAGQASLLKPILESKGFTVG